MRRDPHLLFFPIGIALAWAGISHWFLHAVGVLEDFRPIFHAITQVESFLTAFALGFMFTLIPRRTESAPPASWQLAVGAISTVGISISAWFGKTAFSQAFWIALCLMILGFVIPRFRTRPGKRSPPNSFVWIPIAFVIGIIGSVLTGLGAALGTDYWWLHDLGRGLILQGVFVSLILGIGGLVLPFMTRGEKPKDGTSLPADRCTRMLHVLAALGLAGTFAIAQFVSSRGALFLRAAIIFAVLVLSADLLSLPKGPGLNRRLMRLAVWMVPLGYVVASVTAGARDGPDDSTTTGTNAFLGAGRRASPRYRATELGLIPSSTPISSVVFPAAVSATVRRIRLLRCFAPNRFPIRHRYERARPKSGRSRRLRTFEEHTKTRERVVPTLVAPFGLKKNLWSEEVVERSIPAIDVLGLR